jgi:hypothetical protein
MSWIYNLVFAAMSTTVLLLLVPIWPRGHGLPLVRNQVKMIEEAHVWVPTLFLNGVAGLYWSLSMSWIHNLVVAAMSTTVLLFCVPIWPRGHGLPLVRNQVKVTEEAHVWVPTYSWMMQLDCIDQNPCPGFIIWWLLQCPPLFCCYLFPIDLDNIICHLWGIE